MRIAACIFLLAALILPRPDGMRDFAIGVLRWGNRVSGYQYLLTDEYPPFSLD
jgi:hypothetical protein